MAEPVRAAATIPWERLVNFAQRAYEAAGVPSEQAYDAAEALVDADGHGTTTHGLKNLRMYITNLKEGRANPTPNIKQVGGGKAAVVLSADGALGHVAAYHGVRKAIELAREYGVGNVIVRDSNHYGHSGFWSSVPVRHNMIGFAFTNARPTHGGLGRQGDHRRQQPAVMGDPVEGGRPEQRRRPSGEARPGVPGHGAERRGRQPARHLPAARRVRSQRAGPWTKTATRPPTRTACARAARSPRSPSTRAPDWPSCSA